MKKTQKNVSTKMAKRIGSGLGVAMLTGLTTFAPMTNVFAAQSDIIDTSKTGSLTIHKYDTTAAENKGVDLSQFLSNGKTNATAERVLQNYVVEGVEFSYLKVGDIRIKSDDGNMGVLYDIPAQLATILNISSSRTDGYFTSDQLNTALKNLLTDNTAGKNALENYFKSAGATAMTLTNANGVTTKGSLPLGLYLVVETKVPANVVTTVDPFFVSLPMTDVEGDDWFYDVDVYPKNQTNIPDLDKMVRQHDDVALGKPEYLDTTTVSAGDTADYLLVSKLPKITSEATYLTEYKFVDEMSAGLTYNEDTMVAFYDNEADAKANNLAKAVLKWEANSNKFTANYEKTATGSKMTVSPTAAGFADITPAMSQKYMVVSYSATVHANNSLVLGDEGNTNKTTLTWKRTSQTFVDTLEDKARVYSFGLDLTKEFTAKPDGTLGNASNVQFVLQNKTDGHYVIASKSSDGVYYVTNEQKSATESGATVISPAASGQLFVYGLEADTYVLTEIHTDAGYSLLKAPIEISITSTKDNITPSQTTLYDKAETKPQMTDIRANDASAQVDNKDVTMSADGSSLNACVEMTVVNTPGFVLPKTGGLGTIVCTMAGAAAAFSGVAVVTRKKKED